MTDTQHSKSIRYSSEFHIKIYKGESNRKPAQLYTVRNMKQPVVTYVHGQWKAKWCASESAAASSSNTTPRFVFWRVSVAWQRPNSNREAHPGFKTAGVTLSAMFTRFGTTAIFTSSGPLKDALRGRHFRSVDEVRESAHQWLAQERRVLVPRNFCLNGTLEMCRRWGLHWRLMSLHSVFAINNFIYSFRLSF